MTTVYNRPIDHQTSYKRMWTSLCKGWEVERCEIDETTWEKLLSDARRFGRSESLWATKA